MAKYSGLVMENCRQRLGLEKDDTSCDLDIAGWSAGRVFHEFLMWEGLIDYTCTIISAVESIYGVNLADW